MAAAWTCLLVQRDERGLQLAASSSVAPVKLLSKKLVATSQVRMFECETERCRKQHPSAMHGLHSRLDCWMFLINKNTNQPSDAAGGMKSSLWWDAGWWLVAVPSLGTGFYRALNRASTHVFLERLALTFRLIITHNQHLCSHYFSTFFFQSRHVGFSYFLHFV